MATDTLVTALLVLCWTSLLLMAGMMVATCMGLRYYRYEGAARDAPIPQSEVLPQASYTYGTTLKKEGGCRCGP